MPGETGIPAVTINMKGMDRGCAISSWLNMPLRANHPNDSIIAWPTLTCPGEAGWSRLSIAAARFVDESTGVTNFSLTSCKPIYLMTQGILSIQFHPDEGQPYGNPRFSPFDKTSTEFRPAIWQFFEGEIHTPTLQDRSQFLFDNNIFSRNTYRLSAKYSSGEPLDPQSLGLAAQDIYSNTFAAFAATTLFQTTTTPLIGTGNHSVEENRLIVVSTVAYLLVVPLPRWPA
jgi:hypothetical protein